MPPLLFHVLLKLWNFEKTKNAVHFEMQCIIFVLSNRPLFENALHLEMHCILSVTVKIHCIFGLSNAA